MSELFQVSMASARVNAELKQDDIAREMGVSKQTIINWEKGRVVPKPAQFQMFCMICKIPKDNVKLPSNNIFLPIT